MTTILDLIILETVLCQDRNGLAKEGYVTSEFKIKLQEYDAIRK